MDLTEWGADPMEGATNILFWENIHTLTSSITEGTTDKKLA